MEPNSPDIVAAHKHVTRNRDEVTASETCGCAYCQITFKPTQIERWTDGGQTALCPACGIDSVIGSAAGYPLTPDFRASMHNHWF